MKMIFLLFSFASCANLFPTYRTPFLLTSQDNFIITNIYTNPSHLTKVREGITINYDVIVKNQSPSERKIDLGKAYVSGRKKALPMDCRLFEKSDKQFTVVANQTFRIQCEAIIPKNFEHAGDVKLTLSIPLEKTTLNYPYIVRAEDLK